MKSCILLTYSNLLKKSDVLPEVNAIQFSKYMLDEAKAKLLSAQDPIKAEELLNIKVLESIKNKGKVSNLNQFKFVQQ